jgi:hypothetical protein
MISVFNLIDFYKFYQICHILLWCHDLIVDDINHKLSRDKVSHAFEHVC